MKDLKKPQLTETFAIKTPTRELISIAKRLTFYTNSGEEDFSFITLHHSWVEMLPLSTKLITIQNSYPSHGIKTIKDLFVAKFIGELNLNLPKIGSDLKSVGEGLEDLRHIIKSFNLDR
tara:strand:- start:1105 stop:1461 length:357 start_codon:yes stop_codon:yes gene_type:complete